MLLIDGHNLIGRAPGLSLGREEQGREELLRRIGAARGSGRETVVVVFDGQGAGATEERFGGIRVLFAPKGRTADDLIIQRLSAGNARGSTVVTSDRRLAERAGHLGARVESSEAFWERIRTPSKTSRASEETPKPEPVEEEVENWLALFRSKTKGIKHNM